MANFKKEKDLYTQVLLHMQVNASQFILKSKKSLVEPGFKKVNKTSGEWTMSDDPDDNRYFIITRKK